MYLMTLAGHINGLTLDDALAVPAIVVATWGCATYTFTNSTISTILQIAAAIIGVAVKNDGDRGYTSFVLLILEANLVVWVGYYSDRNAGNAVKELEVSIQHPGNSAAYLSDPQALYCFLPVKFSVSLVNIPKEISSRAHSKINCIPTSCRNITLQIECCESLISSHTQEDVRVLSGKLLSALQELSAPSAMAKRNGVWGDVRVRDLVVGDLIQLKGGDVIPADSKVDF